MTGPADLPSAGVPPEEAIAFFRAKGFRIGFNWQDVFRAEHARWFTVAKAMSRDLLEDIRAEVDKAITDGTTLEDFKKALRPKLEARGWWGRKPMIDPATGRQEIVQLGSPRRLKTIFNANVRTAYAAGKWQRIERTKAAFPFLEYSSVMDGRERPEHHAWDGTIQPVDSDWWDTHYPPCDWECRCDVIPRTQRMLDRKGLMVTTAPVRHPDVPWTNTRTGETGMIERGIGKGWDYNVGKEYLRGLAPSPLPESFDGPDQVDAAARLTKPQAATVDRFLGQFGIKPGGEAIWEDRDGWPLSIGRGWFIGRDGRVRLPKVPVVLLALTLKQPDTINFVWVRGLDGRALLMRRYVRRVAGTPMQIDVGRESWRWRWSAADQVDAANRYQKRHPAGTGRGGQFASGGSASSFVGAAINGTSPNVDMMRLGDVSDVVIGKAAEAGVRLKSPALWLESGRVRHIHQAHGSDRLPIRPRDIAGVKTILEHSGRFNLSRSAKSNTPARLEAFHRSGRVETVMVFEARRRGLMLHTMFRRRIK
ncbi:phage minor head protein [Sphingomonas sp. CJ99]